MRKIIILLMCLLMIGCTTDKNEEKKSYSILCPSGAPAIAFYNNLEDFDVAEAGVIKTQLLTEDGPDIAVLPSNIAVSLVDKGINYKLASTITFGNFFVCATGRDEDDTMDVGDNIVLFSEGSIPDLVFHYIYGNIFDESISYVTDANVALTEIVNETSEAEYVLIAQPALSIALTKNTNAYEYANLQKLYKEKTGYEMFQASLLVNNNLSKEEVDVFLLSLEQDINNVIENPEIIKDKIAEYGLDVEIAQAYFGNVDASIKAIKENNEIGLGYKNAYENKEAIDNFLSLFNIEKTNEEIYYK